MLVPIAGSDDPIPSNDDEVNMLISTPKSRRFFTFRREPRPCVEGWALELTLWITY